LARRRLHLYDRDYTLDKTRSPPPTLAWNFACGSVPMSSSHLTDLGPAAEAGFVAVRLDGEAPGTDAKSDSTTVALGLWSTVAAQHRLIQRSVLEAREADRRQLTGQGDSDELVALRVEIKSELDRVASRGEDYCDVALRRDFLDTAERAALLAGLVPELRVVYPKTEVLPAEPGWEQKPARLRIYL